MGTRYSAVFYARPGLDQIAISRSLFAAVDEVDRQMSPWKPDSALNRLNAAPLQQWLPIPRQLLQVLQCALQVSRLSGGTFDIGVGDLVNAWGFGAERSQPDPARIDQLHTQPRQLAADVLQLDIANSRVLKQAAVSLDLCGIAKGYGVDQLACCLDDWGITNYLVGIDGEMRAQGCKPDGQPWVVAMEKPVRGVREVLGVLEIGNAAIATSGDYRHWVELDGKTFSHTMQPGQQAPVSGSLTAVSVIESSCMLADAWATALLVAGPQAGPALVQARGMDAVFVLRDGDGFRELSSVQGRLQP
ncbi:FAD:protein FMN transferase [Pseudomonas sp. N040]|nr:FAD:protein FMN transferase [Pseudomonas sp. N040]MBW7012715.1 FAD:protein FMN transferase [Pseudomonas sp. N040]